MRFFSLGGFLQCGGVVWTAFSFFQTLLSRASQDDGWLATVSDAPPHRILGGASVAHYTSGHGTAVASADTSDDLWDAAERHRLDVHHDLVVGPGRSS
ncbi:hypothetical protein EVAR_54767_1 [Eumeta japonica]|uniref:Uncharacterized protein n=1 Tax=Eumeta variegata TaxID=151549 RepID=A0A4C1YD39_EUMVA|nr:hypothetical protein EVAR_54767_1 [Eumeta japonica]